MTFKIDPYYIQAKNKKTKKLYPYLRVVMENYFIPEIFWLSNMDTLSRIEEVFLIPGEDVR